MSDCSTAAMVPKEQPKTCRTCEHLARARDPKAASMSDHVCLHMVTYVNDPDRPNCGGTRYLPRRAPQEAGQLEQCCQHLEQVALDAIKALDNGEWLESDALRDRLEALGVDVNAD